MDQSGFLKDRVNMFKAENTSVFMQRRDFVTFIDILVTNHLLPPPLSWTEQEQLKKWKAAVQLFLIKEQKFL